MKLRYTALVLVVFSGLLFIGFDFDKVEIYERPIQETVSINVSYQLQNNIGRILSNVDVKIFLPMFAQQSAGRGRLTSSGNETLFSAFQIEKIKPNQVIDFHDDYLVDLTEPLEDPSSAVIYRNNLSDKERLKYLETEWQKSNDAHEFILNHPEYDSILFLASALSEAKPIRIVAGVDKMIEGEQKVKCWLQQYYDNKWQTIAAQKNNVVPFKVMSADEKITDAACENSLVEAWALKITDYKVILKTKVNTKT